MLKPLRFILKILHFLFHSAFAYINWLIQMKSTIFLDTKTIMHFTKEDLTIISHFMASQDTWRMGRRCLIHIQVLSKNIIFFCLIKIFDI